MIREISISLFFHVHVHQLIQMYVYLQTILADSNFVKNSKKSLHIKPLYSLYIKCVYQSLKRTCRHLMIYQNSCNILETALGKRWTFTWRNCSIMFQTKHVYKKRNKVKFHSHIFSWELNYILRSHRFSKTSNCIKLALFLQGSNVEIFGKLCDY